MKDEKIIKLDYQIKAVLKFCFSFLIAVAISIIVIYFRMEETLGKNYYDVLNTLMIKKQLLLLSVVSGVLFLLGEGIVCAILILIFVSHKIAGPFFRLEKIFESLGLGDLTILIRLRANDQLRPLADILNNMISAIKDKVKAVKESIPKLDGVIGRLKGSVESGLTDIELKGAVKDLEREISDLKKSLDEFET